VIRTTLALISLVSCAWAQQGLPDVAISQLHEINAIGETAEYTRMGRVELSFTEDDEAFLRSQGGRFFNLSIYNNATQNVEWVVRNAFISAPNMPWLTAHQPGYEFGLSNELANGLPWTLTIYGYSLSTAPLATPTYDHVGWMTPQTETCARTGRNTDDCADATAFEYESIGPWIGTLASDPPKFGNLPVPISFLTPIDEGFDECAPAAVARSIDYMARRNGVALPLSAQSLSHLLAGHMFTTPDCGTSDDKLLSGKCDYVEFEGLPICTQMVYGWNPDTIAMVAQKLDAGCDIEVMFDGAQGREGHVAMLTSITYTASGNALVGTVDDFEQGDGVASNDQHVVAVDPSGKCNNGSQIDGFLIECWGQTCECSASGF
jgi:hypothetical protein